MHQVLVCTFRCQSCGELNSQSPMIFLNHGYCKPSLSLCVSCASLIKELVEGLPLETLSKE